MSDAPTPDLVGLDRDLSQLAAQVEGQQVLLDFLMEMLALNLPAGSRAALRRELQLLAEHYGADPESLAFHRALRAIAQPRPKLRLILGGLSRDPDGSADA